MAIRCREAVWKPAIGGSRGRMKHEKICFLDFDFFQCTGLTGVTTRTFWLQIRNLR